MTQKYNIHLSKIDVLRFNQLIIVRRIVKDINWVRVSSQAPTLKRQLIGRVKPKIMSPALRLKHQGKCRIAGKINSLQRVHLDGYIQHIHSNRRGLQSREPPYDDEARSVLVSSLALNIITARLSDQKLRPFYCRVNERVQN